MYGGNDRIAAQIVTGIGFLGAGLIFREGLSVKGVTTAATIWSVAAVGVAIGVEAYIVAVVRRRCSRWCCWSCACHEEHPAARPLRLRMTTATTGRQRDEMTTTARADGRTRRYGGTSHERADTDEGSGREQAERYDPQAIEREVAGALGGRRPLPHAATTTRGPKWYALTMFPYTSGDLHIGHWYAMAPSDAQARYKRMRGYNVLFPMGFDAFGLPAENAAIKHQAPPGRRGRMANIERMRGQLKSMGAMFDWSREVDHLRRRTTTSGTSGGSCSC